MNKKYPTIFIALILTIAGLSLYYFDQPDVRQVGYFPMGLESRGGEFEIPIKIVNIDNVTGSYMNLSYNPSVVEIHDAYGSDLELESYKNINNNEGYIGYAAFDSAKEGRQGPNITFVTLLAEIIGSGDPSPILSVRSLQDRNCNEVQRVVDNDRLTVTANTYDPLIIECGDSLKVNIFWENTGSIPHDFDVSATLKKNTTILDEETIYNVSLNENKSTVTTFEFDVPNNCEGGIWTVEGKVFDSDGMTYSTFVDFNAIIAINDSVTAEIGDMTYERIGV